MRRERFDQDEKGRLYMTLNELVINKIQIFRLSYLVTDGLVWSGITEPLAASTFKINFAKKCDWNL